MKKTYARPFALLVTYDNGVAHRCDISSKREKIEALYDSASVTARNESEAREEIRQREGGAAPDYRGSRTVSISFQVRNQETGEWVTEKWKTV